MELVQPNIAVSHQIYSYPRVFWYINLKLDSYKFLNHYFLHFKESVVLISYQDPPCAILDLLMFLYNQSIWHLMIFFGYAHINVCLSSTLNGFIIFSIGFRIKILSLDSHFHSWETCETFENLIFYFRILDHIFL